MTKKQVERALEALNVTKIDGRWFIETVNAGPRIIPQDALAHLVRDWIRVH